MVRELFVWTASRGAGNGTAKKKSGFQCTYHMFLLPTAEGDYCPWNKKNK